MVPVLKYFVSASCGELPVHYETNLAIQTYVLPRCAIFWATATHLSHILKEFPYG